MEVCVDSTESAQNAEAGGACRVELCANLVEGGTTPSVGMLHVIKKLITIPVFVMIRPRGGDFCYNRNEVEVMKEDIRCLKQAGADGFVFGALTCDGDVDEKVCSELLVECRPLPSTFHRAIDLSRSVHESLNKIIHLGFSRVLTSGQCNTALLGIDVIKELVDQGKDKIVIMPGGGITADNLTQILQTTGVREFHGTAREAVDSLMRYRDTSISMGAIPMAEYTRKVTSAKLVASFVQIANEFWNNDTS